MEEGSASEALRSTSFTLERAFPCTDLRGPVTLQVNGVATAITTVIPAGSTSNIDVPGTVSIADGDRVSVVMDRGASSAGFLEFSVAYEIR
jgi:hypothetical protein